MFAKGHSGLLKCLVDFGLSKKEAQVYLATLELEVATVNEISKKADVKRSSTYVVLESLKKKGFVGVSDDKKVRKYVASSPELLLYEAETRAKKAEDLKNKINNILPQLKALHKETRHRPKVMVFEGIDGIKKVYWDIFLTKTKDLRTYANPVNLFRYIPDFTKHDQERGKRGIKMYAINPATKENLALYEKTRPHAPYEVVLIPEKKFKFLSDMGIYGDRVSFVSSKEKFGVIIESREIAEILKSDFDLAWAEAKRLHNRNIGS